MLVLLNYVFPYIHNIFNNRSHMIKLFRFFLLQGHFFLIFQYNPYIFILIKAIVWPKPVDHPYIIKLETVVDGCVFCYPFYPLIIHNIVMDIIA